MTFEESLQRYKKLIETDIATYSDHVRQSTEKSYGKHPAVVTDAFFDLLQRGGKRIRGALVMVGYEMCGGTDERMIARAATALEMIHAYILIMDDIQDRSELRRGKPTVHMLLAEYHRRAGLKGDAAHAGVALAINAALTGSHAAQMLLAGLQVTDELKLKAIGIVNHTMITTAHGQTTDITNELTPQVTGEAIEHALEWKTAHYTVLNPLCTGMVLAGAGCEDTDAIRDYALHVGRAFQITDDVLGVFGTAQETGKQVGDDIREGKQTILTQFALEHASAADQQVLRSCLGNQELTTADQKKCQQIIRDSGALTHAQQKATNHIETALASLDAHTHRWDPGSVVFLKGLAEALLGRNA